MFGAFPAIKTVNPKKVSFDEWHKIEVNLSKTKANYSVNGELFATVELKADEVPTEGYLGMISYSTPY